jgi:TonB family protein
MISGAQAQIAGAGDDVPRDEIHVDLVAQPLAAALQAYDHIAGLSVLIDASLLDGRVSAPLSGNYSREAALQRLLEGTGLRANFTSANAVVIVASPVSPQSPQLPSGPVQSGPTSAQGIDGIDGNYAYAIVVQARLTEALCRSRQTRPGGYRAVVQMRIDDSGSVTAVRLIDSTGDAGRDAAIVRVANGLVFDSGPPPGLRQPVTILLRPLGNGVTPDCPPSDGRD